MDEKTLDYLVKEFRTIKNNLIERKLSEIEASILATRLLELPRSISSSQFYQIKQREDFKEYKFIGTEIVINKISKSNSTRAMQIDFSYKRGFHPNPITLKKNQALLFYSLVVLKYSDFSNDAIGGFSFDQLDKCATDVCEQLNLEKFSLFSRDDLDNLARKLSNENLGGAIDRVNNYSGEKIRLSFPPNRISFISQKVETLFDDLSNKALSEFNQNHMQTFTE